MRDCGNCHNANRCVDYDLECMDANGVCVNYTPVENDYSHYQDMHDDDTFGGLL